MKSLYERRYKNGIEYPMLKALGLNKPTLKTKIFYFMLMTAILVVAM